MVGHKCLSEKMLRPSTRHYESTQYTKSFQVFTMKNRKEKTSFITILPKSWAVQYLHSCQRISKLLTIAQVPIMLGEVRLLQDTTMQNSLRVGCYRKMGNWISPPTSTFTQTGKCCQKSKLEGQEPLASCNCISWIFGSHSEARLSSPPNRTIFPR